MEEQLTSLSCEEFAERLAARTAVPGGGGACALVGALGAALCSMAGAYTVGKPRYADVEDEVRSLMDEAEDVRFHLLELVDEDAAGYAPVGRAYALAKDDPGRPAAIQSALEGACMAPLAMMGECCRAVMLLEKMGQKGSKLLVCDVATGALLVRAALEAASVNVYANTTLLEDRDQAGIIESTVSELLDEYVPRAERLALAITDLIGGRAQG